MADVGSLGQYKVVVTADYTQLQQQFKAMTTFINDSTRQITESLNKSMGAINATMIAQLQTSVNSLKRAFDGLDDTTKKGGDGFKSYASQIREAEKAAQKCHQEITALQNKMAGSSTVNSSDVTRLEQLKAKFREIREQTDRLKATQADYNMRIKETANLEAMAAKAKKQADQEGLRALREQAKARQDEQARSAKQDQAAAAQKQREIRRLTTQYKVALEEINKYTQAHAKMSEAVFIRLQGKATAYANEIRRLNQEAKLDVNPLAGMNYNQYASQFSKWNDFFTSLKHHLTWMASAMAIGTVFAIPAQTVHTIAEVEKQMAQMKQVNKEVESSQQVLNMTTKDFIGIAEKYGASVNEVIKAGVLWGRQYKDLNDVMRLTSLSAKLAVADNMDVGLANRAVESVINGYQKQGEAIQFANHVVDSWTKIAHNAQSSATDLAEALMRTGAAAKAVGVDFDTTNALASAMIKSTGRSGAEVGNALKSLFSSIHSDKAIKQLEALGIQMYRVDVDGQKHFRNLHDVFVDLMITSHTTSKNMEKDLLAISGGKFQWSKVASVLGSYRDFIHAYTLSIQSANFANGQIEAQLDTINRKYEQLKATLTGIATGVGASGLSAYIKNILSSLNAFAKAIQKIPANVWKAVGAVTAFLAALGSTVIVLKLFAGGISALVAGYSAYTAAVTAGTIATEGWAAATTVATGGLNILLGVIVAAVAAFLGYNAMVSQSIKASDDLAQKGADAITAKEQEIQAMEKQVDWIATLCESHVKLQEELETTKEGTEQNARAKEDLAATDNELAEVIGKNAADKIDWSRNVQDIIKQEQDVIRNKIADEKKQLADAKLAQLNYTRNQVEWTKNRIEALKSEGYGWDALKDVIENFVHFLGRAMVTMGESFNAFQDTIRSTPILGKIAQMMGYGDEGSLSRNVANGMVSTGNELQSFSGDYAQTAVDAFKKVPIIGQIAQWDIDHLLNFDENGFNGLRGGLFNSHSNRWNELEYQEEELKRLENQERQEKIDYLGQKIKNYDNTDSGVVDEGAGGGNKKGSSPRSGAGAKEADNSPEAMGYRYLTGKGLDKNMVLGILGNIAHESSFNPDATNGNHWGMIQWDSDRWGRFLDEYLSMRGMSQSDYYSSDVNTKRTLQYDYIVHEMTKGTERGSYQKILDAVPSTPEQWAHLINMHYERSGIYSGGTDWERQKSAREYATRFERKNGEDNYTDGEKAIENAYKQAKKLFDLELQKLKYEREMKGEKVTALDEKALYEKIMFVNGKNPYALLEQAQKDYQKQLLEAAKYEAKRQEDIKKSTETQVKAIEKMADSEIAFAEKIGLINKADVRNYEYEKNERNYATKMPALSAKLGATVDMSKGTADDMVNLYKSLIHAQDAYEAEHYAKKVFSLSRDVDATQKALDEMLKLEQSYQDKRAKLEQDAFEYKNRYTLKFIDSLSSAIGSSLEGILTRTKTFAEAFRDIFKAVVNDIIKLFSEDFAQRIKKWLTKAIYKPKATGNPAGSYVDTDMYYGGKKSKGNGFNLLGWAGGKNGVSLLGGGYGKSNPLLKAMGLTPNLAAQAKAMITPVTYTLRNSVKTTFDGLSNLTAQGMNTISAGVQTGTEAMSMTFGNYKVMQVQTNEIGDNAIIAKNQSTAATVQATSTAMMGWLMAILALFSLFGGHKGDKTSHSTSSTNLGRAPETYYMTPTPVMQSTNYTVPSMDIGGNIERDMLIFAHKNEMVLTPEQADVIRSTARAGGNMGNSGNASASVKSNINVSTVDSRGFDRVLRDYSRDLSKNIKKSIRNGYLNAKGLV